MKTASAREQCAGMIDEAVRLGTCEADRAWHMTPGELLSAIERLKQRRLDLLTALDTLAWLAGQYAAVAINAPGKYPARPNRVRYQAHGDRDMQRMMAEMAQIYR